MTTLTTTNVNKKLSERAAPGRVISQIFTFAGRNILKMRRTPEQLIDVTFQPILFTVMFAFLFGGAIAGDTQAYLPILIPGILVQTILTATVNTGVQIREDLDRGITNRFRSLPISRMSPLAGALLGDTVRYCIATILCFATGYVIGFRSASGMLGLLAAGVFVVICSWSLTWIFAFLGVTARSAGAVQGIGFMVLFPLTFLSNAYVPIDTLPPWLAWFAEVNPVSHIVSAVREITNEGSIGVDFWVALLGCAIVIAVFAPLTVRAYMRKV